MNRELIDRAVWRLELKETIRNFYQPKLWVTLVKKDRSELSELKLVLKCSNKHVKKERVIEYITPIFNNGFNTLLHALNTLAIRDLEQPIGQITYD